MHDLEQFPKIGLHIGIVKGNSGPKINIILKVAGNSFRMASL